MSVPVVAATVSRQEQKIVPMRGHGNDSIRNVRSNVYQALAPTGFPA